MDSKNIEMNDKEYFSIDAISFSGLVQFEKSPLHYQYFRKEPKKTKVLNFGTAYHMAVLQPSLFFKMYSTDKEQCSIENLTYITKNEYETIMNMKAEIYNNDYAFNIISAKDNEFEKIIMWHDKKYKVKCKAKIDCITKNNIIFDFKTTKDGSYSAFSKSIGNYKYYMQGAFYCDGLTIFNNKEYKDFVFFVQEKEPPYLISYYALNPFDMEYGRKEYKELLNHYKYCLDNNEWNGYPNKIITCDMPPYFKKVIL